jgi:hypothetical protein
MKIVTVVIFLIINSVSLIGMKSCTKGEPANWKGFKSGAAGLPVAAYWEPLTPDMLANIEENIIPPEQLKIAFFDYDANNPESKLTMWLTYDPYTGNSIHGEGSRRDFSNQYFYKFTITEEFFDIIDYIIDHESIFFSYDEFDPNRPGRVFPPYDAEEIFQLMLTGVPVGEDHHNYCIFKAISPSNPVPEIQHVIDLLKTQFRDVLLQHSFELPPEPGRNPPWQFHGGGD